MTLELRFVDAVSGKLKSNEFACQISSFLKGRKRHKNFGEHRSKSF